MRWGAIAGAFALGLAAGGTGAAAPVVAGMARGGLAPVTPSRVRVESGALEATGPGTFAVRDAVFRAVVPGASGRAAGISFLYRGPTRGTAPLASGELRRQVGLKLLARDTCNVLYVMWRIAPGEGIHVQAKLNPAATTHRDCRDGGYRTVAPVERHDAPRVAAGERHALAAAIEGGELRVTADGALVWRGPVPEQALALAGPPGVRSDNADLEVELEAADHMPR